MFISGYNTVFICKECGDECKLEFEKQHSDIMEKDVVVQVGYQHPLDSYKFHNGLPSPCRNNGELLGAKNVSKQSVPVIEKGRPGYY